MNDGQHAMSLVEVGQEDFKLEVLESKVPVLAVFTAPWSTACANLKPAFVEVAERCADRVKFVRINVDDHPELGVWYEIQYVPTVLCFFDGQVKLKLIGTASTSAIMERIERLLADAESASKAKGK